MRGKTLRACARWQLGCTPPLQLGCTPLATGLHPPLQLGCHRTGTFLCHSAPVFPFPVRRLSNTSGPRQHGSPGPISFGGMQNT